ncbi:hypothetical protein EBE87_27710 [Pseudoroseomonas wenyumeiae]|uniref:Bacteriophage T5 Orf172 DNA-binding domain-containing protein n=1 Tax=Teichococcus wenyumeiae TaxID=2478470 RepID=A0A3A9JW90_9PROT|nr:GIY-YIG nuclease family protein [Pseudoroseomonas wenyumeiae]RKK03309.1 hypothetical protein D6Z83_15225 [Pseudoroseomonas wenyumeiae]RMI14577.1 hypothetical protein EBE87_27710 [Pseudoroseomonas wenyumeiae]
MTGQWREHQPETLPRFLYVLRSRRTGSVKFGISNNWRRRLDEHRASRGDASIELVESYEDNDWLAVKAAERTILRRLRSVRAKPTHGLEWFPEDHPEVLSIMRDLEGCAA